MERSTGRTFTWLLPRNVRMSSGIAEFWRKVSDCVTASLVIKIFLSNIWISNDKNQFVGNAYAFLYLYQHTGDATYLHRAVKFAEIITDASADQFRVPDHPLSLYEGTAGVIHFLFSLLQPPKASFPGYQLL